MPISRQTRAHTHEPLSTEGKYEDEGNTMSFKDDQKQQSHYDLRHPIQTMKQEGRQLKEFVKDGFEQAKEKISDTFNSINRGGSGVDDKDESALGGEEGDTLYSLRNRVINLGDAVHSKVDQLKERGEEFYEEEVEPRVHKLKKQVRKGLKQLKGKASQAKDQFEDAPDDETEGYEDEDEDGEIQLEFHHDMEPKEGGFEDDEEGESNWKTSLKKKGSSLLHQAEDLGTNLKSRLRTAAPQVEEGIKSGMKKVKQKINDFQQQRSEEEEEEGGEDDEDEEDEVDEDEGSQPKKTSSTLRSAASTARHALNRGKVEFNDAIHKGERVLNRTKAKAGHLMDSAKETLDANAPQIKSALKSGKHRLEETAHDLKKKLPQMAHKSTNTTLKGVMKSAGQLGQRGLDFAAHLKDKAVELMEPSSSPDVEPGEEDFDVRLEPIHDTRSHSKQMAKHMNGLKKRSFKQHELYYPAIFIGALFLLWGAASLYQHFGHPIEEPEPLTTVPGLLHAAHDMKEKMHDGLESLRSNTQEFADIIVGRKVEPTYWDHIKAFGLRMKDGIFPPQLFGKKVPVNRGELHGFKNDVLDGIHRAEDQTYRMTDKFNADILPNIKDGMYHAKDSLLHAKDYTRDHIIPTARDGFERMKDVAQDTKEFAEEKAGDLGIIERRSLFQQFRDWITGHETPLEKAQRLAKEGAEKASGVAHDLQDRFQRGPSLKDRFQDGIQDGIQDVKETLSPRHTFTDRIKDGLHSIRTHLPGYQPNAQEIAEDVIYRAKHGLEDMKDTAGDYYQRAKEGAYDAKDTARDYYYQAQDRAGDLRQRTGEFVRDGRQRLEEGFDSLKDQLPNHEPTLGERIKNGVKSFASHLPGGCGYRCQQQRAEEAAALKYRQEHGFFDGPDLHHDPIHGTNPHLYDEYQRLNGRGHIDPRTLPLHDAVPMEEILAEIRAAQPPPKQESLGQKLSHVINDAGAAIKSHLPHRSAKVQSQSPSSFEGESHIPTTNAPTGGVFIRPDQGHFQQSPSTDLKHALHDDSLRSRVQGVRSNLRQFESEARSKGEAVYQTAKELADRKLHRAKKEVEYVGNRARHNAEKLGHRVHEQYDEVKDRLQYHMP